MIIYNQTVTNHVRSPCYRGEIENPDFRAEAANTACGDTVVLTGRIRDDILVEVGHESHGCMLSQAFASLLAEYALNKSVSLIREVTPEDLCNLAQLSLGPYRLRCAIIALEALHKGIERYAKQVQSN
jgi:nitrogen fixation protein NifU and related proteins